MCACVCVSYMCAYTLHSCIYVTQPFQLTSIECFKKLVQNREMRVALLQSMLLAAAMLQSMSLAVVRVRVLASRYYSNIIILHVVRELRWHSPTEKETKQMLPNTPPTLQRHAASAEGESQAKNGGKITFLSYYVLSVSGPRAGII